MSKPEPGQAIKVGDDITADWLNSPLGMATGNELEIDGSSGLEGYKSSRSTGVRLAEGVEFWAKITGGPSGSAHPFREQYNSASGTFANGPRTGNAYETGGSTATLTNKYVRVWWGGRNFWFQYC